MKKLLTTTYGVVMVAMVLLSLLFVATLLPIPGGVKVKVVKSGSMEPYIKTGSIVAIMPASSYAVGDVITFGRDTKTQIPTTHRILTIQGEGSSMTFTTKGDANDAPDNAVTHQGDIEGRMLFTIPYVGYALAFLRTKLGFFLLVGVPALLVFLEEGYSLFREINRMRARRRRVPEVTQEMVPRRPEMHREPVHADRKKIMTIGFLAAVAIGTASIGSAYGNTLAYYANTATSAGNLMQAAVFDTPPAVPLAFSAIDVTTTDVVLDATAPQDPSLEDATSSPDETVTVPADVPPADPPADPPQDPPVEVSTSDATISQ